MKVNKIDEMAAYTRVDKFTQKDNVLTFMYDHNESVAESKAKSNTVAFDVYLNNRIVRRYIMSIDHYRGGRDMNCRLKAVSGEVENGKFIVIGNEEDFGKVKITFEPDDAKQQVKNVMWEILRDIDIDYYESLGTNRLSVNKIDYIRVFNEKSMDVEKYSKPASQYNLTQDDVQLLLKRRNDNDDDIDFIQKCLDEHGIVFTDSFGKEIDAKMALKTLGSDNFLTGVERAAFNGHCSMGIGFHKVDFNASKWHEKQNVSESAVNEKRLPRYSKNIKVGDVTDYGIYVGRFGLDQIKNNEDKVAVADAKQKYNKEYVNVYQIKKLGQTFLDIFVCDVNQCDFFGF